MKLSNQWPMLVGFLAVTWGVAAIGGLVTSGSVGTWYPTLAKPAWNPPSWVFGPVWTILYTLMAVAAWMVWRRAGWCGALAWWGAQLALNAAWSPLFFGLHRIDLALMDVAALWLAVLGTTVVFWKVSRAAGGLFVPYLAWASLATALNFALWRLNP